MSQDGIVAAGGAAHLPPHFELLHEAVVGLGKASRFADTFQGALNDTPGVGGAIRISDLGRVESVRVLPQQVSDDRRHRARFAHHAVLVRDRLGVLGLWYRNLKSRLLFMPWMV